MSGAMIAVHAAVAAKARETVLDAFRAQGATEAERARSLAELGVKPDDDALKELISSGIIRGVDARRRPTVIGDDLHRPTAFYLDEVARTADDAGKRRSGSTALKWLAVITIVVALVAAGLLVNLAR
ncbi:MAG TPA: hypothetical protein VM939_10560 [Gemmatimonadaceae bacterium]|nr:hypothetical protein [Gemmatimonadaceae bacterium]